MVGRCRLVATLALLAIASTQGHCTPTVPLPPLRVPEALGVNIHFTDPAPGEMKMLAAGGYRWVRMDFEWEGIEHEIGRYDFSAYDRLIQAIEPYHVRAIFILDYGNPHYDSGLSPHSDACRAAFARWAAASVRHFRGHGIVWEMYNEPNISFWKPTPNVADYTKLALAVGKAIRAAAPGEIYAGPATSGFDFDFLEACFKAGLLRYWDAVSVHPYRGKVPETAASDYRSLRIRMARYAPPGKRIPILSGEWGYTELAKGLDITLQGKYLSRQWLTNLSNGVPVSIWYDWHDDGTDPKDGEHHFGTVLNSYHAGRSPVYDPKPAYRAARTLSRQLAGFTFNKALVCGGPRDHVLLFTRGKDVRIVAWSETAEPHAVMIPASPGTFHAVGCAGEAQPVLRAEGAGLRVPVSDAPLYLAPTKPNDALAVAAAWWRVPMETRADNRTVSIVTRIVNPLRQLLRVKGAGTASLAPRESTTITETLPGTRSLEAQAHTVRLRFELDHRTFVLTQPAFVVAARPLIFSVEPISGSDSRLMIENPTGAVLRGTLQLDVKSTRGYDGLHAGIVIPGWKQAVLSMRVDAATDSELENQEELAANISNQPSPQPRDRTSEHPTDVRVSATLKDATGATIIELPETRILTIKLDRPAISGAPPAPLTVYPDGKPEVLLQYDLIASAAPGPLRIRDSKFKPLSLDKPSRPAATAYRLRYKMGQGERFVRIEIDPALRQPLPGKPKTFGLWVYGDGNKNYSRMRYLDATGQEFQTDGQRITWTGWRFVHFSLDPANATHTGGANDGVAHYPIHIEAPLVMWNGYGRAVEGTVWFACPTVMY